jgi:hypothetical protein
MDLVLVGGEIPFRIIILHVATTTILQKARKGCVRENSSAPAPDVRADGWNQLFALGEPWLPFWGPAMTFLRKQPSYKPGRSTVSSNNKRRG